ncbi:hypothetical protein SAMN02745203_00083 [Porphyromonas crevioricanis]|nr:hypothetical protein SAMN02745203_00083 [Porphyromonas crevioricanis]
MPSDYFASSKKSRDKCSVSAEKNIDLRSIRLGSVALESLYISRKHAFMRFTVSRKSLYTR